MPEPVLRARRVLRSYRQTIEAHPDAVFPLLCPVREPEWLDGWECTMIYTASGLVEEGAVLSTASPGEEDTVWIVSRHDPAARQVEFTRFTPRSRTCLLKIAVSPCGERHSYVDVSYAYTSLSPAGDAFLDAWTEQSFRDGMRFWERSMNHFLKTGTRLSQQAAGA